MNRPFPSALLAALGEPPRAAADRGLPEAQVASLVETATRYAAGCPFKPGDLVTPRANHNVTQAGEPHVVLEVFETPHRFTAESAGSSQHLARVDMRVATVAEEGELVAFAVESWKFEAYSLPTGGEA